MNAIFQAEQPFCEDSSPVTNEKCRNPASIVVERFGVPFFLCGTCALRHYLRNAKIDNADADENSR